MSYATATTVISLLPLLPQTTTSNGYTQTTALITSHIARSDNVINGKIAKRYDVKTFITSVPPLLKTISEDISSYYTMRSEFTTDNQNENEWVDKFNEAMQILDEIKKGDIDLVDENGDLIEERQDELGEGLIESTTEDYQSFFDEDDSLSWKVDKEKLESIRDSR